MRKAMRFTALIVSLGILLSGCGRRNDPVQPIKYEQTAFEGTIICIGDSLTAGYGVNETDTYPAQLEHRLRAEGFRLRVLNAGISGETSSGAHSRITWLLKLKPDIIILETGANDGLRGIDPQVTEKNIEEIVRIMKKNNVTVVLAGMRMVTNLGRNYTNAFTAIYPTVARKFDLILIPFFLQGVAGEPSLNQGDGIHPLAKGYQIITDTVYPYVIRALKKKNDKVKTSPRVSKRQKFGSCYLERPLQRLQRIDLEAARRFTPS
jgi:acyl-CoA thioesterase-1